jgi:uncharacterized domain HDIG
MDRLENCIFSKKFLTIHSTTEGMTETEDECIAILKRAGCSKIVIEHCVVVEKVAKKIAEKAIENGQKLDKELVIRGSLLHDIGRHKTDGLMHAVEGVKIAKELGIDERVIKIIEKHIGGGIDKEEALRLGLPENDYVPKTLEEKIVCHADNLIATTRRQTVDEEIESLEKKGEFEAARRVKKLHEELSRACGIDLDCI